MKKLLFTVAISSAALQLWSAGFQLLEQGASNMGTALAGSTTNANGDSTAAFWNPSAVLFTVDSELKLDAVGSFIAPSFMFSGTATYPTGIPGDPAAGAPIENKTLGGDAGDIAFVPNGYGVWKFDEDWALTMSVTSTYGLTTEYDNGFVGSLHGIRSELFTVDINPSIAYKPCDWASVSAGISAQYLYANLTQSTYLGNTLTTPSQMKGTSWGVGWNLGATIEYAENGRIGLSYRSNVDHTAKGDMYVNSLAAFPGAGYSIEADMTSPATINAGIYQRLWDELEDFAVMLDYTWTQWSSFEALTVKNAATGGVLSNTQENWKNTSRVSFGIHYYATDDLTLRLGAAWDESPVSSAEYRTVRVPDTDRIWISGGLGYKYKNFNFDLAYTYVMLANNYMNNTHDAASKGTITGTYEGHSHVISFQMGVAF